MKSQKYFYYPRLSVGENFLNTKNGVFYTITGRYSDNTKDTRILRSYDGSITISMSVEEFAQALCDKTWFKLPIFVEMYSPKNRLQTVD